MEKMNEKIKEIEINFADFTFVNEYEQLKKVFDYRDNNTLQINIQLTCPAIEDIINYLNYFNKINLKNKLSDMLSDLEKMRELIIKYSFVYDTENEYEPEMENFVKLAKFSKYYDKTKNMNKIFEEYCIFFIKVSRFITIHKARNKHILKQLINRNPNYINFEWQKNYQ